MSTHAPVIALATGGRKFAPSLLSGGDIEQALTGVVLLIEGEAPGFDSWCRDRARSHGVAVQPVPALWAVARALRRPVGPEGTTRNARMLRWAIELSHEYRLALVLIAGPGGTGTADMRRRCSNLVVREVRA